MKTRLIKLQKGWKNDRRYDYWLELHEEERTKHHVLFTTHGLFSSAVRRARRLIEKNKFTALDIVMLTSDKAACFTLATVEAIQEPDYYEYTIPTWAVCPLYYGTDSYGDLTDEEISAVEKFAERIAGMPFEVSEDHYFCWHNDITGNIGADCTDLKAYVLK